ncbi:MAG: hypothetical protein M0013_01080 [Actinomycetota bacterium]|nr:hypothetical protein [Actinomycetota bacterium]
MTGSAPGHVADGSAASGGTTTTAPAATSGRVAGGRPGCAAGPAAPEPEVLAAVVAAATLLLRSPAVEKGVDAPAPHVAWRFSGRWWSRPTVARRDRPRIGR